MEYPKFYDEVEKFILKDELSQFLGATKEGIVEIGYIDCVKLAGHSCPTIASSYIAAKVVVDYFYKGEIPLRSQIKIEFKEECDSGVTGVIGNTLGFILGCSDKCGFSGIGGKFNRKDLISYGNSSLNSMIRFSKLDGSAFLEINIDTSVVKPDAKMKTLLQKALQNVASKEELEEFERLWQDRVKNMLLNKDIWNKIIKIVNKG
ncbi:MAG: hypothetical protein GXN91_00940 [Epsilonproteobacteria bacterium]|nr:hypothetical protein [Campylobacterota bacterium]